MINNYFIEFFFVIQYLYYAKYIQKFNTAHQRCKSVLEIILKPKGMLYNADLKLIPNNH